MAEADDLAFARALTRQAMMPYYTHFGLLWQDEAFDQAWAWRENWRVLAGAERAGVLSLSADAQGLYIRELHLLPQYRGQGLGGRVLAQVAALAAQRRLQRVRLMVFRNNPAQRLYRRAGFVELGEDECFLRMEQGVFGHR